MRVRRKTIWGEITPSGELSIFRGELAEFYKLHPGKKVIVRVDIMPTSPSEKLTNYFFGYVVKMMREAMNEIGNDYNESQTYDAMRSVCPIFVSEERVNGKWRRFLKEWEELDQAECVEVIAFFQRFAAEQFSVIIENPE